jgi:hypothetical protein
MKFGHLEQTLEWSNQNMCKKFLKNNAQILNMIKVKYLIRVPKIDIIGNFQAFGRVMII